MSTTEALAAIHKTITVDASVETAFDTFTRQMGSWWPTKTHSIFQDKVQEVVFDERTGGRVYERGEKGEEADWADVLAWEPPARFVLRWRVNPERGPTEVEVRFTPENGGTRVDLEHRGWDEIGDAEGRAGYDPGWDFVLGHYTESFTSE
ncbi:MAG: SRPBCC domain-containing protein [Gaiellaceae bacterium]